MRYPSRRIAQAAVLDCCAPSISIAAPSASSLAGDADVFEPDAASVPDAMSNYLGGLKSFSVAYDIDMDVVSDDAEKPQFTGKMNRGLQTSFETTSPVSGCTAAANFCRSHGR